MSKITKTTLMIAGILFASFAFVACNSSKEEKKAETSDTTSVKSMEVTAPAAAIDTTKKDTAATRPTPNPN